MIQSSLKNAVLHLNILALDVYILANGEF